MNIYTIRCEHLSLKNKQNVKIRLRQISLILLMGLVMCLVGCTSSPSHSVDVLSKDELSSESETVEKTNYFSGEMTITFSYGERSGTYEGNINDNGLPEGTGTFVSQTMSGNTWTYSGEWKNGHWEGHGSAIWGDGSQYVGEYSNDAAFGNGIYTFADGAKFVGIFSANYDAVGTYYPIEGDSFEATMINAEIFSNEPEPVSTSFFSDRDNRLMYDELYKSYRYSELKKLVQTYIDANEVTNDDVAYTILEYIDSVIPFESEWNISFDEFDSKYVLTFNGASEISSNNSVSVSLNGTDLEIKIGFRKNGWLFFDSIALSVDGKSAYSASVKSYNRTDNVISGHTIEEYCLCGFYDSVLESVGKAETVILRFSNEKSGEKYDHTLSQIEKDALYCGLLLRINNRELSNLIYHYRNDNNIND